MSESLRLNRWIKASISTIKFDPFMMPTIQGLGRLDVELIQKDRIFLETHESNRENLFTDQGLGDQITLSYLWVLGAYEAIRTMDQRIREDSDLVSEEMKIIFRKTKQTFNRLRVPLAKMEAAQSHKSTDSHIAYPGINLDIGISWQVNECTFISRRELSDQLLTLMEEQRKQQIQKSNEAIKIK